MKNGPINYKKFIVVFIGLLAGIVVFSFTHIWFFLGLGFALCVASLILD